MDGNQTLKYGLLHGKLLCSEGMSGDLGSRLFNKLQAWLVRHTRSDRFGTTFVGAEVTTGLVKLTDRVRSGIGRMTANGYRGPEEDHFGSAAHPRP